MYQHAQKNARFNLLRVYTIRAIVSVDIMKTEATKKVVGYRLSSSAVSKLEAVSKTLKRDKTDIVEELIEQFCPVLVQLEANRIAEAAARYGASVKNVEGKK
jgi:predicted DNA-binding protein